MKMSAMLFFRRLIVSLLFFVLLLAVGIVAYTSLCRPCFLQTPIISARALLDGEAALSLVEKSEANVVDLRPGMGKEIIWFGEEFKKTEYSIVYVHGFSASKEELRPVPDILAKTFKANLFYTRLAGHGQLPGSLGEALIDDWLNDIVEAAHVGRAIGEKVIFIGASTGASLITWLVSKPELSADIAAVIFVSPNYGLRSPASAILRLPFGRVVLPIIFGPTRGFTPANSEHAFWWTPDYPTQALVPMVHAIDLAVAAPVENLKVPAFFVFSTKDKVVNGRSTLRVIDRWGGPKDHLIVDTKDNPGNHVPAGTVLSPSTTDRVTAAMAKWLRETLGQ